VVSVLQKTDEDESAKRSYYMISTIMKKIVAGRTCVDT
jgi:hypothetical protein